MLSMTALARAVYVGTGLAPSSFLCLCPGTSAAVLARWAELLRRVYPERSEYAQHDSPCQARVCRDGACPVLVPLPLPWHLSRCPRSCTAALLLYPVLAPVPPPSLLYPILAPVPPSLLYPIHMPLPWHLCRRPRLVGTQILRGVYPERSEGLRMT